MDLVHKVDLAVLLAELVFCVHEDETHLGCDLSTSLEDGLCVCFKLLIVFAAYNALSDDFLLGDVLVVAFGSFCCRGDDRGRELLVLNHSFRHLYAADGAFSCLVLSPGVA